MINYISPQIVLQAAVAAAHGYVDLVTEHDPDEGPHVVPRELRIFLGRLRLLHGVPFSYMVPNADLLPIESIRFFYLDRAWTDALTQGVLSVGTVTTADRAQLEAVYPRIREEVDEAERKIRLPKEESSLKGTGGTITGFLMRSKLVSGWPNLHVRAYRSDTLPDTELSTVAESHPDRLKVLRMERLAPAVLLVLFDGVPVVMHIEEPRQGIQFGVRFDEQAPASQRTAKARVRNSGTGNPLPPLNRLTSGNSVVVPFRPGAPGVIDMAVLRQRLIDHPGTQAGGSLESSEYALQMLRFPYRQVFGDPRNEEGQKFYSLDRFKVTVSLTSWKQTIQTHLERGNQ